MLRGVRLRGGLIVTASITGLRTPERARSARIGVFGDLGVELR
jgi:hypothetical protein